MRFFTLIGNLLATISASLTGCLLFIGFYLLIAFIPAWCWTYTINFWLVYLHKPPAFHLWWHGYLVALFPGLGQSGIPAAFLTWLISFFL